MGMNPERFGRLLSEAIHRIKIKSNKLIQAIQDELGYAIGREGGSAIEYWRTGHVPSDLEEVERLAREILKRIDLGRRWLKEFLSSAGHPLADQLCDDLYPSSPRQLMASQLPARPYRVLIGRERDIQGIIDAISYPQSPGFITIDGLGGIGKSALAIEIVHRVMEKPTFEKIIWLSAASSETDNVLTFDKILNEIAIQLEIPEINSLPPQEKSSRMRVVMSNRKLLIVLDNLDTARESQSEIINKLKPIIGRGKALLTSRRRFDGDVYGVHLMGLNRDDGINFIRQESKDKNVNRISASAPDELEHIVNVTDGSPLAMKLVVGQLGYLPLEIVLNHLEKAIPLRKDAGQDEYVSFYRFIFMPSWDLLSEDGKKLLLAMALFPPEVGGSFEAIRSVSRLTDDILEQCIDELWRLSFLEIGESTSIEQLRYYLHSLTRYFVRSDIVRSH